MAPDDAPTGDTYTHGHHPSVLRSHEWRTVENSAPHLLPRLWVGHKVLDLGCGPGTITVDLADRVAPGETVGIDTSLEVVERARANAAAKPGGALRNLRFDVGDVYDLEFEDDHFDVVHAHQVLQHLTDPVAALREARRVLAPGGLLAVRDSDYGAFVWAPADARLTRWLELYHQVTRVNEAEADAGRYLPTWVRAAGFTDLEVTSSTWTFADRETCAWWGDLWAERAVSSAFATQAVEYGLSDRNELASIAAAFRTWSADPDATFVLLHVEVLAVA
jgi:ubiquinone/menaquinone biosynthesis C-methylase UbiE